MIGKQKSSECEAPGNLDCSSILFYYMYIVMVYFYNVVLWCHNDIAKLMIMQKNNFYLESIPNINKFSAKQKHIFYV